MYLKTVDLPVQESLNRLCASDPMHMWIIPVCCRFCMQEASGDRSLCNGCDSGSLQHHAS